MDEPRTTPDPSDDAYEEPLPDEAAEEVAPATPKRYANVSPTRRGVWVVGGLVGGYMIIRGLYGVITGEDQQP